ncbi:site-2 protease family protein [Alkalibacillus sp. S2W]|uniref:site-2 protease family protein n=1 Tax=Alkalibacillus sp. S2W TaxID=3386553 RepID=UPI00398D3B01
MTIRIIELHPLLLIVCATSYVFGWFLELLCLLVIVLIHEFGHVLTAKYFGWNVTRVVIWPFGGVMETSDYYNRPLKEEWLVTIAGPLQHIWLYAVIIVLDKLWLNDALSLLLLWMNSVILVFNLIPVLPLDGGRLLLLFLQQYFSFYRTIIMMAIWSIVFLLFLNGILWINQLYSLQLMGISIFLILDNWFLWRQRDRFLLKHLLSRHLRRQVKRDHISILRANTNYSLSNIVKEFKRNHYHYVYIEDEDLLSEDDCLTGLFGQAK